MNIAVTGSVAYDYLMKFPGKFTDHLLPDQLHQISLSFLVESMSKMRGGTAPNIAYTLGLLGGNPTLMATVGNDFEDYRKWLEGFGVNTAAARVIENEPCASFFANTDSEQNQIASFYAGAMAYAAELSYEKDVPTAQLTIISPNDPVAMQNYVREAKKIGLDYIYDPSQQTIWLSGDDLREGLDGCYMLTVNEYEMGMIEEKTGLSRSEIVGKARGVLITKGKDGSELTFDGETYEIPIFPINDAVDPTGAGDSYRAGMMRGIQLGLPWEVCGRMGALASAYVLESNGPQGHSFTIGQFIERYRNHFDDNGALNALLDD
ncbi:MAG: carbohydrate kinase family protein [Chloroflexota bacterium]